MVTAPSSKLPKNCSLTMDAAFVPSEFVVKQLVSYKVTLEIGPSITPLGKLLAKLILSVVVIYCLDDILLG
jgi:hypothetical protein